MNTKKCKICGKVFNPSNYQIKIGQGVFCSKKCSGMFHRGKNNGNWAEKIRKICITCGKEIIIAPSIIKYNPTKFCSRKCYAESQKISQNKNINPVCLVCGKTFHSSPWYVKKGYSKYCSFNCMGVGRRGNKSSSWKGGVSTDNELIRASKEYSRWRTDVYRRDGFKCVKCGHNGKDIQAHHKKAFSVFLELRFSVENGITLCKKCHNKEHIADDRISSRLMGMCKVIELTGKDRRKCNG